MRRELNKCCLCDTAPRYHSHHISCSCGLSMESTSRDETKGELFDRWNSLGIGDEQRSEIATLVKLLDECIGEVR